MSEAMLSRFPRGSDDRARLDKRVRRIEFHLVRPPRLVHPRGAVIDLPAYIPPERPRINFPSDVTKINPRRDSVAVVEGRPHLRPWTLVGYVRSKAAAAAVIVDDPLQEVIRRHAHAQALAKRIPPDRVRSIGRTGQRRWSVPYP